jgi:hypothetical protein
MLSTLNKSSGLLFVFLLITLNSLYSQEKIDTNIIEAGVTSYLIPEGEVYSNGCVALGASLFFHDEKVSLQIGYLYDILPKYIYIRGTGHFDYRKVRKNHIFIPVLLHYNLFSFNRINFSVTGGIIPESRPEVRDISIYVNPAVGLGISHLFFDRLRFSVRTTAQYTTGVFVLGMVADLSYRFKIFRKRQNESEIRDY